VLGELQQRYPEISFHVLSTSDPIGYAHNTFDIGLQYDRVSEDRFTVEALADELIFPVCSPQLASRLSRNPDPAEIAQQPLLNFVDYRREWISWKQFLSAFDTKEPVSKKKLTFSSYEIYLDMAEKGEGIALGWACSIKNRLETGRLVRISHMSMPRVDGINIYRQKTYDTNPISDHFVKLLRDNIEGCHDT